MVDVKQIEATFHKYFSLSGVITLIDPHTGLIDVDGDVYLKRKVSRLPVRFAHVTGSFVCSDSKLTTLAGAPHSVRGVFDCSNNVLTSLVGAPEYAGRDFKCAYNKLTNLKGAPDEVGVDFNCVGNPLVSLEGAPSHVKTWFVVSYSPDLPLLRTLVAKSGVWLDWGFKPHNEVQDILRDPEFKGKGRAGAIKCAFALILAGKTIQKQQGLSENPFKENARW
jgi:hypothetical protein